MGQPMLPSLGTERILSYSPNLAEGSFSELRAEGVLKSLLGGVQRTLGLPTTTTLPASRPVVLLSRARARVSDALW